MYLKLLIDYLAALFNGLFSLFFVGLIKSAIWFHCVHCIFLLQLKICHLRSRLFALFIFLRVLLSIDNFVRLFSYRRWWFCDAEEHICWWEQIWATTSGKRTNYIKVFQCERYFIIIYLQIFRLDYFCSSANVVNIIYFV